MMILTESAYTESNYYSLNSDYAPRTSFGDRLAQFLNQEIATTTETKHLCNSSPQSDNNHQLKVSDTKVSLYESKNTTQKEKVESAIALVKVRKRNAHIPNPAGYFVAVLKENWHGENALTADSTNVDQGSIFRYWYDLTRELGYCSGQEIRDNEQWVCSSGTWEKWSDAVKRGYSLDYLKKIVKRNGDRS